MAGLKNYLTIGNKFSASSRRKPLSKLLDAVGTDEAGKLNSTADRAGVVNSYIAAMPQRERILSDAEAAVAAGKMQRGALSTLKRGFGAADTTLKANDDIVNYLDRILPQRLRRIDSSGYTPPEGYFNLKDLAAPPGEIIGTPQEAMHLSVPNTFNIDEFAARFTPERVKAMQKAAVAGGPIGGQYWYNMAPIYEKFVQMFGPEEGAARFRQWARDNAALSPRSAVDDQTIRESQINYFLNKHGRMPTNADMKAEPDMFGHLSHNNHLKNIGLDDLAKLGSSPKIGSYYQNYLGNLLPGTMDVHHFTVAGLSDLKYAPKKRYNRDTDAWERVLNPDGTPVMQRSWVPVDKYYTPLELATGHLAERNLVMPAEYQASVWNGLTARPELMPPGKRDAPRTSDPYAVIFDRVLRDSADIRGKSADDMFRDAMERRDYLTRPAGARKTKNNEMLDIDEIEGYAGGGLVKKAVRMAPMLMEGRSYEEAPRGALSVVKPKGGNWRTGSVETMTQGLRRDTLSPEDMAIAQKRIRETPGIGDDYRARAQARLDAYATNADLNNWIDKQLVRYIKNELATPEDPLRALAEQGVLHTRFDTTTPLFSMKLGEAMHHRKEAGIADPMHITGKTPQARAWDSMADAFIVPSRAGTWQQHMTGRLSPDLEKDRGWMMKVPPETPVYALDDSSAGVNLLGFDDLVNELRNSLDPASGLPHHLLLDPKSLSRVSVPQAVERVHNIKQFRTKEAREAEERALRANLLQKASKEYPNGWRWVELPDAEASPENANLVKSIGCQGGWCTRGDEAAVSYGGHGAGNRLHVLMDSSGRPHVQVHVRSDGTLSGEALNKIEPGVWDSIVAAGGHRNLRAWLAENRPDLFAAANRPRINELKPLSNSWDSEMVRDFTTKNPEYKNELMPMIQDFVRGQEWSDVGDFENTGLLDLKGPRSGTWGAADYLTPSVLRELSRIFPAIRDATGGAILSHPEYGLHLKNTEALDAVLGSHPIKGRYVTEQELIDHLTGVEPFPPEKSYRRK